MWTAAYHRTTTPRQDTLSLSNLPAKRDKSISSSRTGNQGLTWFSFPAFGDFLETFGEIWRLHSQSAKRFEWKSANVFANILIFLSTFLWFWIYWTIVWGIIHWNLISSFQQLLFNTNLMCFSSFLFPLPSTLWLISFLISQHPPCLYFYHCKCDNYLLLLQEF